VLAELEARLPVIRTQAIKIQLMYDSGRQKVRGCSQQPNTRHYFSFSFSLLIRSSDIPLVRPKRWRRISDG
jgi:hypothetical protein